MVYALKQTFDLKKQPCFNDVNLISCNKLLKSVNNKFAANLQQAVARCQQTCCNLRIFGCVSNDGNDDGNGAQ